MEVSHGVEITTTQQATVHYTLQMAMMTEWSPLHYHSSPDKEDTKIHFFHKSITQVTQVIGSDFRKLLSEVNIIIEVI